MRTKQQVNNKKWNDLLKMLSELVNDGVLSENVYYYYCSEFIKKETI